MIKAGVTPAPVHTSACGSCSLVDACRPERLHKPPRVDRWLAAQFDGASE